MTSSLRNIRVVDFSRYLSGPSAAMLLGDLGAEVVKVEGTPRGDPARESGPFHGGESVYYMSSNRNKRSIALNLRDARGLAIAKRIAAQADVVIQNFKPGLVESLGLDYDSLRQENDRLVYCSISGFGSSGPGKDLPGFDQSAQAMSGLMSVTGTPETGPLRVGIAVGDSAAGVFAAVGILAALVRRADTGRGSHVETSLLQSVLSLMNYQAQKYLSLGEIPGQDGNDHPLMFPQGSFPTRDKPITIASGNEAMWRKLCDVLGCPELAEDARFRTNALRMDNRVALRQLLENQLREESAEHWVKAINRAGIPATPIYSVDEALDSPITRHLGMVGTLDHPTLGPLRVVGTPISIDGDVEYLRKPPPLLGQHTVEISRELGLSEEETRHLVQEGVLYTRAPLESHAPETAGQ
jgi:crotonobetainyl-CoA:carnitine CoA-transferase CaiB-like acyl-CoA transferase